MSETPRTDDEILHDGNYEVVRGIEVVLASFARQLERELNEANKFRIAYKLFEKVYGKPPSEFAAAMLIDRDQWKAMAQELADDIASRHGGIFSKALSRFNELNK